MADFDFLEVYKDERTEEHTILSFHFPLYVKCIFKCLLH